MSQGRMLAKKTRRVSVKKSSDRTSTETADKTSIKSSRKRKISESTVSESTDREVVFDTEDILKHVRPTPFTQSSLTDDEKIAQITVKFSDIMKILGLDLSNDSLHKTPHRVAKMYVQEIFQGLKHERFPRISVIENDMGYDQMIAIRDISILSFCEHHFITIEGKAHIAYIPNKRVIGLSKINRIARYFSRRPQVQERLTKQIADCLAYVLDTEHVAVYINAKHFCVVSRGIEDVGSTTMTCDLRGAFKDDLKTRTEFMTYCNRER